MLSRFQSASHLALLLLCFLCLQPLIPQSILLPAPVNVPISPTLCLTLEEIQRHPDKPACLTVTAAGHEGCPETVNLAHLKYFDFTSSEMPN